MVLSIQTSPGRNLPLDAPVASTRHTQIALASCSVGITSKCWCTRFTRYVDKFQKEQSVIWTENAISSILIDWGFCHLPLLPTTLQDCLHVIRHSHIESVIKVTQYAFQTHSCWQKTNVAWNVRFPSMGCWKMEVRNLGPNSSELPPASTPLEAYQFHELRSPNQLPQNSWNFMEFQ